MYLASIILSAGALVSAAPTLQYGIGSCTFKDAATAAKGKSSCTNIVIQDMVVAAGTTLDLTDLKSGTTVTFQGTTTFGYKEWEGPLMSISGTNIKVTGAKGHVIDGNGPKWWDGKGGNGGKKKPKFFAAHSMKQSSITGLNIKNTPVQGFSIDSAADLVLDRITIDNSDGDGPNGGHNTDAFDIGKSTGVTITNANVKNQDDCLAINSGENIKFIGGTCSGGHGISIGSVGGRSNNDVKNVEVSDCTVTNSVNGVRIKTISGAIGSVSNVNYKNIKLENISKYGIVVEQDYQNGSPTGKPTAGVPITGLTLQNVQGTITNEATNVYILCGDRSCRDWNWSDVSVAGGKESTTSMNVPDV